VPSLVEGMANACSRIFYLRVRSHPPTRVISTASTGGINERRHEPARPRRSYPLPVTSGSRWATQTSVVFVYDFPRRFWGSLRTALSAQRVDPRLAPHVAPRSFQATRDGRRPHRAAPHAGARSARPLEAFEGNAARTGVDAGHSGMYEKQLDLDRCAGNCVCCVL
jgi:hypothetical protein